ncbi:hypothetical protein K443DRAFT_614969 [Laccaria amethystina LaAM-08-1]|uniref:Uncharacterized protein n=1 Tax=Laccaria amethystina LaAM-08-1 TaxID=1095629 RepID=A0A0C9XF43_9AGAR|nr:hypothetical protein K443DRAFT_614969 [Laccaria amethystina LaAM-08-1]
MLLNKISVGLDFCTHPISKFSATPVSNAKARSPTRAAKLQSKYCGRCTRECTGVLHTAMWAVGRSKGASLVIQSMSELPDPPPVFT